MGRATVRDPEFLKELQELRQKHPSPYIGLFIVKDAEEAKQKGTSIVPGCCGPRTSSKHRLWRVRRVWL